MQAFERRIERLTASGMSRGAAILRARKESARDYNEWMAARQSGELQTMAGSSGSSDVQLLSLRHRNGAQMFTFKGL